MVPISHMKHEVEFPLWPAGAPGALGASEHDIPTLTPYWPAPAVATGATLLVLPGGGYANLSPHEGEDYAKWLASQGIAAFVLKYRLGSQGYQHPTMWIDATRAMRTLRHHAGEWGLDRDRIGVVGSSAGGHLASTLVTHFDLGDPDALDPIEKESSRPDVGILLYPVISMGVHAHLGSKTNLLGAEPSKELEHHLSTELHISRETPPCFLMHTWEDPVVKVENSLLFAEALRANGVRFDLHIFENGPHGLGLGRYETERCGSHPWMDNCLYWLRKQRFLPGTVA